MSNIVDKFNSRDKRNISTTIKPEKFVLPNKVGFVEYVPSTFLNKNVKSSDIKVKDFQLQPHQKFVQNYLANNNSPYRGLLFYHLLGSGKTCSSITVSETLINNRDVVVMLPAALRNNFVEELRSACGNDFYASNQYWEFFSKDKLGEDFNKIKFVDDKVLKKNKGLWVPDNTKTSNFSKLNDTHQSQINNQVLSTIENRYKIMNYDGLRKADADRLTKEPVNPFNNKVIIIDEYHNFNSRVVSGSSIARSIYSLLLKSVNSKIVLLSATPIINFPYEVSFIVNLAKGIETLHSYKVTSKVLLDENKFNKIMESHSKVDRYFINHSKRTVNFTLLPEKFVKSNGKVTFSVNDDNDKNLKDVFKTLNKEGFKLNDKDTITEFLPLPIDEDQFNNLFIEFEDNSAKNTEMFIRRSLGSVSYVGNTNPELFPTLKKTNIVKLPLTDNQFNNYVDVRSEERKREQQAKKFDKKSKAAGNNIFRDKSTQVFKTFTRGVCNFSFPPTIKRPYPSKLKQMTKEELDDFDEAFDTIKQEGKTEDLYTKTLDNSLRQIWENRNDVLDKNLKEYSPKFDSIIKNIKKSPGSALVYSQFRKVEGLGLLSMAMRAQGFEELKLKKVAKGDYVIDNSPEELKKPLYAAFTGDKDKNRMILRIFNSEFDKLNRTNREILEKINKDNLHGEILKVLMITQSGSEGISLKNTRQVHIVEPYWNNNRIEQVIGRASRLNSHINLPKEERDFEVFIYVSTFTDKQLKDNISLRAQDKSKTTDQAIFDVAERKKKIIGNIIDLMKSGSVDCLSSKKYEKSIQCFSFPINVKDDDFSYELDVKDEKLDKFVKEAQKKLKVKPIRITVEGKDYIYVKTTNELFDYDVFTSFGVLKLVGKLEKIGNSNYKLKLFT